MRKVILPMNVSLDGFVEGPHGEMDWFAIDDETWKDMYEQLGYVDTVLLGRVTFQIWENYWPAAGANPASSKDEVGFSRWIEKTPKIVFSRTLDRVGWKNARLVQSDIAGEIARLKALPGKDIALAGGAGIARAFIKLGLIDEYHLRVCSVILGGGKPLFKDPQDRMNLQLLGSRTFSSGMVGLNFRPAGKNEQK